MIILVDEDGKKVLGNLLDVFLKANGLGAHQQVNQILSSARDLNQAEVAREMLSRQPKPTIPVEDTDKPKMEIIPKKVIRDIPKKN